MSAYSRNTLVPIFIFCLLSTFGIIIGEPRAVNVYCYYASWAADRPDDSKVAGDDLDPTLCTHIFYAYLSIQDDGSLAYVNQTIDVEWGNIEKVSNLKKINPDLKLLFSVGSAAGPAYIFETVASNDTKLSTFVKSCEDFLDKYNFDGIDIDWEYDTMLLIQMAQALKDVFQPKGRLVTTASAYNPDDAGYEVSAMNRVFDLINDKSFNFHEANAGILGGNSPLFASSRENPWQRTTLNCNGSLWTWRNRGASPEKLSLGVGFYGQTFIMADSSKNQAGDYATGPGEKGPYTDNAGTLGYLEICQLHKNGEIIWDDEQKIPHMVDGDLWIGYDNEQSLQEKVKYIKQEGLAGIMIWSIETDDVRGVCGGSKWTLLNAIKKEINNN